MLRLSPQTSSVPRVAHMRAPVPLHFPESAEMPESSVHLLVRTFLYQLLRYALGPEHSVGSDQFVYWMRNNPRVCLAPDVFVKLGVPQTAFPTWRCWQRGAPDLAVEVVSPSDSDGGGWDEKLARYGELGVEELVRFDPEEQEGRRLRVWDRVEGDFVERLVEGDTTPCLTLGEPGVSWVVSPVDIVPVGLRLADHEGKLIATESEAAREADVAARRAAEARVRELEEELRKRR